MDYIINLSVAPQNMGKLGHWIGSLVKIRGDGTLPLQNQGTYIDEDV